MQRKKLMQRQHRIFQGSLNYTSCGIKQYTCMVNLPDLPIMAPVFVKPSGYQVSDVNIVNDNGYISSIPDVFLFWETGMHPISHPVLWGGRGGKNGGCQCYRSELDRLGRTAYNMPIHMLYHTASCHIIILYAMQDNS